MNLKNYVYKILLKYHEIINLIRNNSPLDVEGVDLNLSRKEIIDILREVRER